MSFIDTRDIELIRHAVGVATNVRRTQWGYRNRFCCGEGDRPAMERLQMAGLVRAIGTPNELTGGDQLYIVTEKGCDFIGLTPAQKKRALG